VGCKLMVLLVDGVVSWIVELWLRLDKECR